MSRWHIRNSLGSSQRDVSGVWIRSRIHGICTQALSTMTSKIEETGRDVQEYRQVIGYGVEELASIRVLTRGT